jgi:hypothetical protein
MPARLLCKLFHRILHCNWDHRLDDGSPCTGGGVDLFKARNHVGNGKCFPKGEELVEAESNLRDLKAEYEQYGCDEGTTPIAYPDPPAGREAKAGE